LPTRATTCSPDAVVMTTPVTWYCWAGRFFSRDVIHVPAVGSIDAALELLTLAA